MVGAAATAVCNVAGVVIPPARRIEIREDRAGPRGDCGRSIAGLSATIRRPDSGEREAFTCPGTSAHGTVAHSAAMDRTSFRSDQDGNGWMAQ